MYASRAVSPLVTGFPVSRDTRSAPSRRISASLQVAPFVGKPRTLYEVLLVKETPSPVEIKTAYRTLAKRLHPDASGGHSSDGSVCDFVEINRAYATLSDPEKRANYDLSIGVVAWPSRGNIRGFGTRLQTRRWETDQCW